MTGGRLRTHTATMLQPLLSSAAPSLCLPRLMITQQADSADALEEHLQEHDHSPAGPSELFTLAKLLPPPTVKTSTAMGCTIVKLACKFDFQIMHLILVNHLLADEAP